MDGRDELRAKLRQKIRSSRNPSTEDSIEDRRREAERLAVNLLGDDAKSLQLAIQAIKDPSGIGRKLCSQPNPPNSVDTKNESGTEEEEAPPPVA